MWIHLGEPRITKKIGSIESGINELFLKFEKSSEASGIHCASSNLQVMSSLHSCT